jgi:MarR family transcriptional regulator, 2-MHQ and catechol-resistance regulon repressor
VEITNSEIDTITGNLLRIMPILHKKLLRMDLGGTHTEFTRLHYGIMGRLMESRMTVTDLANDAVVPKSQLTHLVDKLVALGMVERIPAADDRRVIHLEMTEHGKMLMVELHTEVRENIKKRLSGLTPEELREFSHALETVRNIGSRL